MILTTNTVDGFVNLFNGLDHGRFQIIIMLEH